MPSNAMKFKVRALELVSLRPGEGRRALLAAIYLGLVIASYIGGKAVRDSRFLDRFGALGLPYGIVAVAIGVLFFVSLYLRLARRYSPVPLTAASLLFFGSNLAGFWWLSGRGLGWVDGLLYVWVGIFGVAAPAQAWIVINELFTTREAKRAFGLIGGGGILGGLFGGWLASALSQRIGTVNVLLVLAALLAVAAVLVVVLGGYRRPSLPHVEDLSQPRHLPDSLRIIAASPHLRLLSTMVFLAALATAIADFQFQSIAAQRLSGDALTAFFGAFYGSVGAIAVVLQLALAGTIFRRLGLGGAILFMPVAMLGATALLIPTLSLAAATLLKGSDSVLKHSIDRSSRELCYLPVSRSIKVHVKSAIDMFIDRLGDGFAGIMLLVLARGLQLDVRTLALINVVVLVGWIWAASRASASYVGELGRSIAEGRVEAGSWHEALAGSETLGALREALLSGDEPRVLAALALVADNPSWDVRDAVRRVVSTGGPELQARALAILLDPNEAALDSGISETFGDDDKALLAECVDLMVAEDPRVRQRIVDGILARAGGDARGAWVALMLRRLGPDFAPFARRVVERLAEASSPGSLREAAATAIGLVPPSTGLSAMLPGLLRDTDRAVAHAAVRSAGALGTPELLAELVELLGRPALRRAAKQALAARGDDAIPLLLVAARDAAQAGGVRRAIPAVFERIGTPRAIAALVQLLEQGEREVAALAADALVRLRTRNGDWSVLERRRVLELALDEAAQYRRHAAQLRGIEADGAARPAAVALLASSLDEALRRHRDGIFRVLSLWYPPRQMALCRRCLAAHDPELRANAAELLDNLEPRATWRQLLPVLEADGQARQAAVADARTAAVELLADPDPWLRACTLATARELCPEREQDALRAALSDGECAVRDTAALLLARRDGRMPPKGTMTLVEKVLALRGLDLFRGVPAEQLSLVAALARTVVLPAGTELCRQDDPPGDMFVLLEGAAELERDGRTLGRLGTGEAVGAWGLFEDDPRPFTARATSETIALRIDRGGFEDVWIENPQLARSLVSQLVRRIRELV